MSKIPITRLPRTGGSRKKYKSLEPQSQSPQRIKKSTYLLIKIATSAAFVVMIQGSSCLYAGPKYNTPP